MNKSISSRLYRRNEFANKEKGWTQVVVESERGDMRSTVQSDAVEWRVQMSPCTLCRRCCHRREGAEEPLAPNQRCLAEPLTLSLWYKDLGTNLTSLHQGKYSRFPSNNWFKGGEKNRKKDQTRGYVGGRASCKNAVCDKVSVNTGAEDGNGTWGEFPPCETPDLRSTQDESRPTTEKVAMNRRQDTPEAGLGKVLAGKTVDS